MAGAVFCWNGASAVAQTSCLVQGQAQLLSEFSDLALPLSIPPSAVRNVICSTPLLLAPGVGPVQQSLGASPFAFTAPQSGTLTVASGEVEVTRQGITQIVSLVGGAITVKAADTITVLWTQGPAPLVFWWADG